MDKIPDINAMNFAWLHMWIYAKSIERCNIQNNASEKDINFLKQNKLYDYGCACWLCHSYFCLEDCGD